MFTRDAMVCPKGLFEQATAQRAVRDRVKFPELVEKKYRKLVAIIYIYFLDTYCSIEGCLLVKYILFFLPFQINRNLN